MANVFAITAVTDRLRTAEQSKVSTVFTVTNTTARPLRGVGRIRPLGQTDASWLKITGESERDFPAGGTHQFTVAFTMPEEANRQSDSQPTGSYPFRFDVVSASNPDEDFTEGPTVTVEIAARPNRPTKSFPWWILIVLLLLLIIGVVGYFLLRPKPKKDADNATPTPDLVDKQATIYADPNFGGFSQPLSVGKYDDANRDLAIGNDSLSSLKVPAELIVRLYEHFHFQGNHIDITGDTQAVPQAWDNKTSSIIVYKAGESPPVVKKVVIFEHSEYNASNNCVGAFQVLEKGKYDGLLNPLTIGDRTLSSALIPPGMVLRVYETQSFQGSFRELRQDTPGISLDWNDRTSSIIVYEDGETIP